MAISTLPVEKCHWQMAGGEPICHCHNCQERNMSLNLKRNGKDGCVGGIGGEIPYEYIVGR